MSIYNVIILGLCVCTVVCVMHDCDKSDQSCEYGECDKAADGCETSQSSITSSLSEDIKAQQTYRAGVYAHKVIQPQEIKINVSREMALENMMKNLRIYDSIASQAKTQGVQILVFPEDGIYGFNYTRIAIQPYLEHIPNPAEETWIPCKDPNRYEDSEVQRTLSCMALSYGLYIVANMGDCQLCNRNTDPKCPSDGHYQFNTNVVYSPDGTLVARYHKTHMFLFEKKHFDPAPVTEHVYFETPFGRFGTFICFDMLFKNPAIDLIEKYNINNFAYPTAWMDNSINKTASFVGAAQYQSAFAMGMKVNLLAANIQLPEGGFHGSGIYNADGYKTFYYNNTSNESKLLIADLNSKMTRSSINEKRKIHFMETKSNTSRSRDISQETFQANIMADNFTMTILDPKQSGGIVHVCDNNLCCELDYEQMQGSDNLVAFGAFDGLHTYIENLYLQICVLIQCAGTEEQSCGHYIENSSLYFREFRITGNFTSKYIFPEVLVSKDGHLSLASGQFYDYQPGGALETLNGLQSPLISAALFSRVYSRD